jgi:hypothetical protein
MARHWIVRETPDKAVDHDGYPIRFERDRYVLGLDADYEATWMLAKIGDCADLTRKRRMHASSTAPRIRRMMSMKGRTRKREVSDGSNCHLYPLRHRRDTRLSLCRNRSRRDQLCY